MTENMRLKKKRESILIENVRLKKERESEKIEKAGVCLSTKHDKKELDNFSKKLDNFLKAVISKESINLLFKKKKTYFSLKIKFFF